MRASKLVSAAVFMVAVFSLSFGYAFAGPPNHANGKAGKVDVCHYDADSGTFHLIKVSENALEAHRDHGDAEPSEPIPTASDYLFDESCNAEPNVTEVSMSPNTVLGWAEASVVGNPTIQASWGYAYPVVADVHLTGGSFTWNYPDGSFASGDTSNLSVVGNVATFEMTVTDSNNSIVQVGWVLGMRITDASPDTIAWWWIDAGSSGFTGASVSDQPVVGDFVVTPSAYPEYNNQCVLDAIAAGYEGEVTMTQYPGEEPTFDMSFSNLVAGSYSVFVDTNGGTPGPWTSIGSFTVGGTGDGTFEPSSLSSSMILGANTWSIWVNGGTSGCGSILQTDSDLSFTLP